MVAAPRRPQYPATTGAFNAPPYTTTMSNFNSYQSSDASTSADPTESLWYIDSGATNHITHDLANLQMTTEYSGPDQVSVANGQGLPIHHTGSSIVSLPSSNSHFRLNNILHVPNISHNLLSAHQFVSDNMCALTLTPFDYTVKDLQ